MPGTITPEPEPIDAVSDAAFPRSSTTEMWVVPGEPAARAPAPLAARSRSRAAPRLASEYSLSGEPAAVEVAAEAACRARDCSRITSTSASIAWALPGRRSRRDGRGATGRSRSGSRPRTAAGWTRTRGPRTARGSGRRQITRYSARSSSRDQAAVRGRWLHDRPAELAAVELARTALREPLERGREIGHDDRSPAVIRPCSP